ncbi:MAG: helix-turn-helix domain-containing protein [Candidatus Fimenecus sp.]
MEPSKLNLKISENLLFYRKLNGLTQIQLAEYLNYSNKSISKWERGEIIPDIEILYNLSNIYKITVSELIGQTPKSKETTLKINAVKKDRRALERQKKKAIERAKKQMKKK